MKPVEHDTGGEMIKLPLPATGQIHIYGKGDDGDTTTSKTEGKW